MSRISRAEAVLTVGEAACIIADKIAATEPTNAPQADPNVIEYAAMVDADTTYLKAYFYQNAEAIAQVGGDLTKLHWSVRDYEVIVK